MRMIGGRLIVGLAVLTVGVLLLLNNLNLGVSFEISHIFKYWPVIPLILGLNWLILSFASTGSSGGIKVFFPWGQFVSALIFIAIGVVFLGRNLNLFYIDLRLFFNLLWPVILILVGINLIRGRTFKGSGGNHFALMGGTEIGGAQPWKLESGTYFAFMGGIEIDLRSAELEPGETFLDLTAIMGGIEVKLARGMAVIFDGSAILGGVSFKDQEDGGIINSRRIEENVTSESTVILHIQARAILGGVEIKEG